MSQISKIQFGCPAICAATFLYVIFNWSATTYSDYVYPVWGECIGIMMAASSILCIPFYFAATTITTPGATFKQVP